MSKQLFAAASLAASLLAPAPALLAQASGPFDLNEGLALSHSESGHAETPHQYAVDLWAKTGRTYVVEETEDLASGHWRRLPLLIVGNDSRYGRRFAYPQGGKDTFTTSIPTSSSSSPRASGSLSACVMSTGWSIRSTATSTGMA